MTCVVYTSLRIQGFYCINWCIIDKSFGIIVLLCVKYIATGWKMYQYYYFIMKRLISIVTHEEKHQAKKLHNGITISHNGTTLFIIYLYHYYY